MEHLTEMINNLRAESDKYVDTNLDLAAMLQDAADEVESAKIILEALAQEGVRVSIGSP